MTAYGVPSTANTRVSVVLASRRAIESSVDATTVMVWRPGVRTWIGTRENEAPKLRLSCTERTVTDRSSGSPEST